MYLFWGGHNLASNKCLAFRKQSLDASCFMRHQHLADLDQTVCTFLLRGRPLNTRFLSSPSTPIATPHSCLMGPLPVPTAILLLRPSFTPSFPPLLSLLTPADLDPRIENPPRLPVAPERSPLQELLIHASLDACPTGTSLLLAVPRHPEAPHSS